MKLIIQCLITLSLVFLPLSQTYAKAGCCSKHGGVAGCDTATGHQRCKDGTDSPSCACEGTGGMMQTTKPSKVKPAKTTTTTTESTTTTAPATVAKPVSKAKTTAGCCSRHGGVAKCNKSTGYQMCKDGTQSTTCTCS